MKESDKPKDIFLRAISLLNSKNKDLRKTIGANKTDPFGDIEVFCPMCKGESLIPVSQDYSALKCLDCKIVFNIPYYLDQRTMRFSRIENKKENIVSQY